MFVFYAHGGSDNHGCEAIIRGTCQNLKGKKVLFSSNVKADKLYGLDNICEIYSDTYKRYYHPVKWFFYKALNIVFHINTMFKLVNGKAKGIYLSVGGDNYCYPGLITPILKANARIRSNKNKTILWGTSIENNVLDDVRIMDDISKYNYIFARESYTYETLVKHGLQEKTFLYPDPAFAMKPEKTDTLKEVFEKEVVGINISPLILKFEGEDNVIKTGYEKIIQYLLKNTDVNILLIPHVVKKGNDDRDAIKKLMESVNSYRVFILDDMSASKLKYVISQCSFFVGARTHSTIAAYSTCVPTLVVGYSIKARGIAKDIFGTDKDYVIDVRDIEDSQKLLDSFKTLYLKKTEINKFLVKFMPGYIKKAEVAATKLFEVATKE